MLGASLPTDLYMIHEDQVFVANVVVIDLTWEIVVTNVINQPLGAVVKISAIVKIRKYRRFNEGHHFIPMAMEVHNASGHDMTCFIRKYIHFSRQMIWRSFILIFLHSIFQAVCQYCFSTCFSFCYREEDYVGKRSLF